MNGVSGGTGEVVLDVDSVAVELGGWLVLEDVSLRLRGGELVGLIGPNGAGKTTLLRAVLAALPVRSGRIELGGVSPERSRGTVGYVPQRHEFAWDFPISVERAVMSGRVHRVGWLRRPGPADHAAVDAAVERVGLTELGARPIGELSGGQRQRVLVARALALDPRLLLLDEPFTGLDVPTQTVLTRLLAELRDEGRAQLMTTHDVSAAAATCTRLCLLNRTIVADGSPDELRDPDLWLRAFGVTGAERFLRGTGGAGFGETAGAAGAVAASDAAHIDKAAEAPQAGQPGQAGEAGQAGQAGQAGGAGGAAQATEVTR